MGSQPVVFEHTMLGITERKIRQTLSADGYLQAEVSCDSIVKKRKINLSCIARAGSRYIIDSIFYLQGQDTLPITSTLSDMYRMEYSQPGMYFQLENLESDRDQLVETANNNGFPFINNKDVIFFVDTLVGNGKVDIHMRLRPSADSTKYHRFRYGSIFVNPNFSLKNDTEFDTTGMVKLDEYKITEGYDFLRENVLNNAIYIKEYAIYDKHRSKITSNRLLDFGIFKFVNIKKKVNPDRSIDHFYNLTPYKMQSISGEIELNNRPGNFLGLAGTTSYIHKNTFGGAERFELSLSGGLETQFGDKQALINTSNIKLEGKLTVPSIVLPFISFRTNRNYIPKTIMSLSIGQQRRTEFYTIRSAHANYGFKWNETDYKTSKLTPIDLSWLVLDNTTTVFDSILNNDRRQALSFRSTLLLGSSYEYVYNKRNKYNPINQLYFKGVIESAGSLLSLFVKPKSDSEPAKLLGTPFAQYLRLTVDLRKYWALDIGSIASRVVVGTGFAFGNSTEVPYSKQFSIGGANSLRAFRLRTLGPGLFKSQEANIQNQFLDQTGDLKIEANIEYRFNIIGYIKGAIFLDAGNVWLYDSENKPEGVFDINKFYKQMGIGTGFGFRFDLDFLLLRFDLAFPIRNVQPDSQFGWTIKDIDFFSGLWRDDNLVFNLGLGYPF